MNFYRSTGNRSPYSLLFRSFAVIFPLVLLSFTSREPGSSAEKPPVIEALIKFPGMIQKPDNTTAGRAEVIVIPLKRAGKLFLIEAQINNETGNFLFDTGSSKLVLNSTYFRKYFSSEEVAGGITGPSGEVGKTVVKRLQLPGMNFTNVPATVSNLGHLENRRGVRILGLFGIALLKNMEVVIDLNRNELYIYPVDRTGKRLSRNPECRPDMIQKIEIYRDVMFMKASISGKLLNFCLDTGAESNVISNAAPKKVLSTLTILRRSELAGAGSGNAEVLYCAMNDFSIGDRFFPGMNAILADLGELSTYYGCPLDGMLGFDFFSRGRVIINFRNLELKLCLNKTVQK